MKLSWETHPLFVCLLLRLDFFANRVDSELFDEDSDAREDVSSDSSSSLDDNIVREFPSPLFGIYSVVWRR